MLMTVVNHPWLLENHAEEFAELDLLSPDADQLRRAVLEAGTEQHADGRWPPDKLRAAIAARGLGAALARIEASITHRSDWPARPGRRPAT